MKLVKRGFILGLSIALFLSPMQTFSFSLGKMIMQNKTAACLVGGLAITSSVLGCVAWKQHKQLRRENDELSDEEFPTPEQSEECGGNQKGMSKSRFQEIEQPKPIKSKIGYSKRELETQKKQLEEALEDAKKRIEQLHEDAAFTKKCSEETIVCLNKERFKTGLVSFILKAYELKNAGASLIGMVGQFKNKKANGMAISEQSIKELLNNIERLKKDIEDIEKPGIAEVDEVGGKTLLKLISILRMRNPAQDLADTVQALTKSVQEINTLIASCKFKESAAKSSGEKRALESGVQENPARVFIRKNEGFPAHQILGIASDAMMPEIIKAYRDLSKQFHSDKAKEADKPDYERAMKLLNEARATMVASFN